MVLLHGATNYVSDLFLKLSAVIAILVVRRAFSYCLWFSPKGCLRDAPIKFDVFLKAETLGMADMFFGQLHLLHAHFIIDYIRGLLVEIYNLGRGLNYDSGSEQGKMGCVPNPTILDSNDYYRNVG
ncbi:MAG: hypothetical protein HQL09_05025 [Nitrospirae bacterium]|nr:hypothetical protein [Nitrospirota bacterium]